MPSEQVAADIAYWRQIIAWGSVSILLFLLLSAWTVLKRSGLDDEQKRHLKEIKNQLIDATPTNLAIHQTEDVVEFRDEVYGLLRGVDPEQATVPQRAKELKNTIASQTPTVPRLAMRGVYEGLLLIVFASVVQLSLQWWQEAATAGTSGLSLAPLFAVGSGLVDGVMTLVSLSPVSDLIVPIAMLIIFAGGEVLYQFGIEVGLALIAGAIVLAWLDRRTSEDLSVRLYGNRWSGLFTATSVFVGGWVLTAIPAVIGEVAGYANEGGTVSLVIGGLYTIVVLGYFGRDFVDRLYYRQAKPQNAADPVALYLLVRKAYGAVVAVSLPLVAVYAFASVSSGKAFDVIAVIADADPVVKLTLMVAVGAIFLALKSQYPDLTNELRLAFYRAVSSRAVRVFLFTRGMPFIAVAIAFLISYPFVQNIYISLAIALVFGGVVRVLTWVWMKTAYQLVKLKEWQTPVIESVIDGVGVIEDADGEPIYITRVDGHGLAHRDKGQLVEATLATVHRRLHENEFPPSFCHYYYGEVTERGTVGIQEVEKQLQGDVETRVEATMETKKKGRMDIDTLDEEMVQEYPEPHYREAITSLRQRGDLERRQGDYVYHG